MLPWWSTGKCERCLKWDKLVGEVVQQTYPLHFNVPKAYVGHWSVGAKQYLISIPNTLLNILYHALWQSSSQSGFEQTVFSGHWLVGEWETTPFSLSFFPTFLSTTIIRQFVWIASWLAQLSRGMVSIFTFCTILLFTIKTSWFYSIFSVTSLVWPAPPSQATLRRAVHPLRQMTYLTIVTQKITGMC